MTFRFLLPVIGLSTVLLIGCTKNEEQLPRPIEAASTPVENQSRPVDEKPFEYCSDHSLCKELRNTEKECRTNPKEDSCKEFVDTFKKLAVKKDCKRKFDTEPVPSIWICDEDEEEVSYPKLFERSASTVSKTKFAFAQKFYGSEAFRSTLDGAVAEDHYDASLKAGNQK